MMRQAANGLMVKNFLREKKMNLKQALYQKW